MESIVGIQESIKLLHRKDGKEAVAIRTALGSLHLVEQKLRRELRCLQVANYLAHEVKLAKEERFQYLWTK